MQNTISGARPLGVTIIAVLLIIAGVLELLLGGLTIAGVFAVGHTITVHGHTTTAHVVDALGSVLGGISLVIGLVTLIFAWGLWTLKTWAFWLVVALEVFSLLRHLYEFTRPDHSNVSIVLGMILPIVILLYFLLDPNVRNAFFRG
jgi:uncharacterized membrane protein (DUF2068 family)